MLKAFSRDVGGLRRAAALQDLLPSIVLEFRSLHHRSLLGGDFASLISGFDTHS